MIFFEFFSLLLLVFFEFVLELLDLIYYFIINFNTFLKLNEVKHITQQHKIPLLLNKLDGDILLSLEPLQLGLSRLDPIGLLYPFVVLERHLLLHLFDGLYVLVGANYILKVLQ